MDKVGRNDPCPCGSGKKYKKCCEQGAPRKKFQAQVLTSAEGTSKTASLFFRKAPVPVKDSPSEEPPHPVM